MIVNPVMYRGKTLPELENPGSAADLLTGKQLLDQDGNPLTGTMPQRSAGDLTASGAEVAVPAGYYPEAVSKSVAAAAHPKPTISRSGGTITARHVQGAGYTEGGTTEETLTIPTNPGGPFQPTTHNYIAASSGSTLIGDVIVKGDANLVSGNIKSGVSIFGVAGSYVGASNYYSAFMNVAAGTKNPIVLYPGFVASSVSLIAYAFATITTNLTANGYAVFALHKKKGETYTRILNLNYNPYAGGFIMINGDYIDAAALITWNDTPGGALTIALGDMETWATTQYLVCVS